MPLKYLLEFDGAFRIKQYKTLFLKSRGFEETCSLNNNKKADYRLLKANCLYCHLLEFEGVVLLDNTKGWAVGSPKEEKLLMAENLKEKLESLKEHLMETSLKTNSVPPSRER